ncbi:WD40 repeat-containing protein [Tieghemostelium lacteum]|uniref:WD40 repeat-containing protein n=1 Tax=Tieghemostelium lacteum TaxID=361077 RepID=A0A151ZHN0_TIELA|nr:WD40 repeat-containing protein [Tieghemostelium lacteum]|eukprot:KYQ93415.1 WD40 repeat-containing protein [Tieghemostelium lacteum]
MSYVNETMILTSKDDNSIMVFDIRTGNSLATFQASQSDVGGFSMIGQDYFITSQHNKALVHVYSWKKDQPLYKTPLQEKGGVIASSNDGSYCAMGCGSGSVYLWEVATGSLLRIWEAHYNKITCISFTKDDFYLVTAGDDGVINTWSLEQILNKDVGLLRNKQSFTDHSLGITSIHCGFGGSNSRLFSVSLDRTCKIWDLVSGRAITSILFPTFLTSIILDATETTLYVGGGDGVIYQTDLITLNSNPQLLTNQQQHSNTQSFTSSSELEVNQKKKTFIGHTKSISSLNISMDGSLLISGSLDGVVNIWDTFSRQVIRSFANHIKGSITSISVLFNPIDPLNFNVAGLENKKSFEPIQPFEKYSGNSGTTTTTGTQSRTTLPVKLKHQDLENDTFTQNSNRSFNALQSKSIKTTTASSQSSNSNQQIKDLTKLNKDYENQIDELAKENLNLQKKMEELNKSKSQLNSKILNIQQNPNTKPTKKNKLETPITTQPEQKNKKLENIKIKFFFGN